METVRLDEWLARRAPGGVLAPLRIMERMEAGGLAWFGNRRILARGYLLVSRQDLWRKVETEELGISPTRVLPDTVLLLLKPPDDELHLLESPPTEPTGNRAVFITEEQERLVRSRSDLLGRLTRRVLMARLEQALIEAGWNLEKSHIYEEKIPSCEMDEIRSVLLRDGRCRADATVDRYLLEFLPWFGMLVSLEKRLLGAFFPGLTGDTVEGLTRLLGEQISLERILAEVVDSGFNGFQSGQNGQATEDEPDPYLERHRRLAEESESRGQWVSAALEQMRESRLCVGKRSENALSRARANLRLLVDALLDPLGLTDVDASELASALDPVLDKADQGESREEAVFLRHLQAMHDGVANRAYALDVVEYAMSLGVRPWKRQLHYLGLVQVSGRLKSLLSLLPVIRVPDPARGSLARVLGKSALHAESRVRQVLHPLIDSALDDVGLQPSNPLERVGRRKIIQELIDRILDQGHITFYDLRDALSRNHLKMHDISDPAEWLQGDPLLRLDRRLAGPLDGIYRPCPLYSRLLERGTSLGFGTSWGRWLVWKIIIPYGLAALLVVLFRTVMEHFNPPAVLEAIANTAADAGLALEPDSLAPGMLALHRSPPPSVVTLVNLLAVAGLGSLFLLFSNHPVLRRVMWSTLAGLGEGIYWLVHDLPGILPRHPLFLYAVHWPLVIFWHGIAKPLGVVIIIFWLVGNRVDWNGPVIFSAWLVVALALTSRQARIAEEWLLGVVREALLALRSGVLMRALGVLNELFRMATRWFDRQLAGVENLLRVRQKDNAGQLGGRALLSLLWFPLGWVGRFVFVVLVEPMLHPLKLPVCFLAAKVIYPAIYPLSSDVAVPALTPMLGAVTASVSMAVLVFLLPNAFGFFFWEFRENRGLYAANRPRRPAPDGAGPHGETMAVLLEPGLHGGVLPALFTKLRQSSLPVTEGGNRAAERACERRLELLRDALGRFFRRNFLDVLGVTRAWQRPEAISSASISTLPLQPTIPDDSPRLTRQWQRPFRLDSVSLAVNRVEATFVPAEAITPNENGAKLQPVEPLRLYFAYLENHLQGWIDRPAWVDALPEEQRRALAWSLAWIYCAAGVEISRESLAQLAPLGAESSLLTGERIRFRLSGGETITYHLADHGTTWQRVGSAGAISEISPAWRAVFADMPFTWDDFVTRWTRDAEGSGFDQVQLENEWIDLLGESESRRGLRIASHSKTIGA